MHTRKPTGQRGLQVLILVRGLPGSGKSTFARSLTNALCAQHLETDMFFLHNGTYKFNANLLGKAHAWCQNQTRNHLRTGIPVIVSNTFTRAWETKPYEKIAEEEGVEVIVYHVDPGLTPEQLAVRCLHDVPLDTIKAMHQRWAPHPKEQILKF